MKLDVALTPAELDTAAITERTVVVFDVLRATTTMAAALDAGVAEIRVFGDVDSARQAAEAFGANAVLCGERGCLPPPGFHLGNSPGQFTAAHRGRTLFMSTTNGTRAIVAAAGAANLFIGSLINARATARAITAVGRDVTLLCAGRSGETAPEDVLGAGAVMAELRTIGPVESSGNFAASALDLFNTQRPRIAEFFRQCPAGQGILDVGLDADIDFAARENAIDIAGVVRFNPLRVVNV